MIDFEGPALTSEFIAAVGLTAGELLFGFRNSWLNERDVIAVALSQYRDGVLVDGALEELALLFDAERERVRDIASECDDNQEVELSRVWIFLFAKWIWEDDDTPESFKAIEALYSGFDYPESLEGFVGFLPADPDEPVGLTAMEDSWRSFIQHEAAHFRARISSRYDSV